MRFLSALLGSSEPRRLEVVPQGRTLEVPPGKTLLEAMLEAGIPFAHDCTVGTCGTCKSRLIAGRIQALSEFGYTLTAQELAANYILPCQSKPKSALVRIETTALAQGAASPERFTARVLSRSHLTHDIQKVRLELDRPIRYAAGQYLNILPPEGTRARSYSFAEAPSQHGSTEVVFFIRKVPQGLMTEALFAGSLDNVVLQCEGPFGRFGFSTTRQPLICVAGGSGLAPILSCLRHSSRSSAMRPCTVLFGARTAQDLYALEDLEELAAHWVAPFKLIPILSSEAANSSWQGERGLVTDYIERALTEIRDSHQPHLAPEGYLCGPPGMVDAALTALNQQGVPLESIFYDKFTDARDQTGAG